LLAPPVRSTLRPASEADSASLEVEGREETRDNEVETTCSILEEAGKIRVAKCERCERTKRTGQTKKLSRLTLIGGVLSIVGKLAHLKDLGD